MAFPEILLSLILGILTGIITGITPGLHVNLVSLLLLSSSPFLLQFVSPLVLGVYLISLAIAHTFLDALPSIYLGAPDESQALNVLPGHRLLLKGEGHNAITYTVIGALGSLVLGILLLPLFIPAMTFLYPKIKGSIGLILAAVAIWMILREKGKRLKCLAAFLLSGSLGLLVFGIPTFKQPLFPLLSGLFGLSLLLVSLNQKTQIPQQEFAKPLTISRKNAAKAITTASGMGFIAAFLPGFSSSQVAIVGTNIVGDVGDEGFLTLVGGINTANMLISIATAYAIEKSRNGAIVVVDKLLQGIGGPEMFLFLAVALVAGSLAAILTLQLSKVFAQLIVKVNYQKLVWGIILFITALVFYFDGFIGLLTLITATAIGLVTAFWGIGKNHLMGCLILPVVLYFAL
jgi:putative membrane protein